MIAWIFFRAENIEHATNYISGILSSSLFDMPYFPHGLRALTTILLVLGFIIVEWFGKEQQYAIAKLGVRVGRTMRYAFYYSIIIAVILFSAEGQQFIYFQF